jgi:hypothetical protein
VGSCKVTFYKSAGILTLANPQQEKRQPRRTSLGALRAIPPVPYLHPIIRWKWRCGMWARGRWSSIESLGGAIGLCSPGRIRPGLREAQCGGWP